ncbi:flagellar basal body rod protein [Bacillus sp. 03113]|uniref:lmo0954 family membrane protein n=1 Tax=Bacillus sp. 03113 TaxID=2578211 RepID=UPI001143D513|nr:flagellar basal body rod protein [Bacillus sp. 03113]
MKKFGLLLIGGIAAVVLISSLGHLVGLLVSLAILYFVFKQFLKAESTFGKIGWGIIGVIALIAAATNAPAILGAVAAYILYIVYKKWNRLGKKTKKENDPFVNFEKEWSNLQKHS